MRCINDMGFNIKIWAICDMVNDMDIYHIKNLRYFFVTQIFPFYITVDKQIIIYKYDIGNTRVFAQSKNK